MKKIISRMLRMHPAAWFIYINSLRISCALLAVSIILFVICGGDYVLHYDTYCAALTLSETAPALLLLSTIASVCVEEHYMKQ